VTSRSSLPSVVVVGTATALRIHVGIQAGLVCYVGEVAIAIVVIEMIVRQCGRLLFERVRMHRIIEGAAVRDIERGKSRSCRSRTGATSAGAFEQRTQLPRPKLCVKSIPALSLASSKTIDAAAPAVRQTLAARSQVSRGFPLPAAKWRLRSGEGCGDRKEDCTGKSRYRFDISVASQLAGLLRASGLSG